MAQPNPAKRSLLNIATIVAFATLLSKFFGLLRQVVIAAAFGVGAAYEAYNYAYILPGFLLILLGGINGPFHSAIVSALAKRDQQGAQNLIATTTTIVSAFLLAIAILLFVFAAPLVDSVAPGLGSNANGETVRAIAIQQFQIMAPLAVLSGLIGIGFGSLNAVDCYWLPSVSPLISSITLIGGIGVLWLSLGENITLPAYALVGGQVLAWGTLIGGLLQWLVQLVAQWQAGLGGLKLRFNLQEPGLRDVLKVMAPATLSSGMLQINVYTDLFFASYIPQAAAALGYGGLLMQTPLGIVSNVILVPLLPLFSRLRDPADWPELKQRIRQGLLLTALTMIPLSALMMVLAKPIVQIVYERYAFDPGASALVAQILVAYAVGMFVYLARDILVRVYYALGDGQTPFRISVFNIFLNAGLDFALTNIYGAPGLVLATVGVNLVSLVMLLWSLNRQLGGLPLASWTVEILKLVLVSAIAAGVSGSVSFGFEQVGQNLGAWKVVGQLLASSVAGVGILVLLIPRLGIAEVDLLSQQIQRKLARSK
ncbi:MAG: murein biosynthesis integral membrane protein MurJ [Pseudanabaenaceae cyanobacterium bins.68]|nr:murein biosynthesis integral membrane protein MurJ [Pseudanabaenaceae cyanobacterium bins.68]